MNDKESELHKIVEIVVECCASKKSGTTSLTVEDVVGNCKRENVVMTRALVVEMILRAGYTVTTIAELLNQTTASVRKLRTKATEFSRSSYAFRVAETEASRLCPARN